MEKEQGEEENGETEVNIEHQDDSVENGEKNEEWEEVDAVRNSDSENSPKNSDDDGKSGERSHSKDRIDEKDSVTNEEAASTSSKRKSPNKKSPRRESREDVEKTKSPEKKKGRKSEENDSIYHNAEDEQASDDVGDGETKSLKSPSKNEDDNESKAGQTEQKNSEEENGNSEEKNLENEENDKSQNDSLDKNNQECTSCGCKVNTKKIKQHPMLKVLLCQTCYKYYKSGTIKKDAHGIDEQCRWCAEGGDLLGCDACHNTFCQKCIERNFEEGTFTEIEQKNYWKCYVCDPAPLKKLQEVCQELLTRSDSDAETEGSPKRKKKDDVECTACGLMINTNEDASKVKPHPTLNVLICKKCYGFCNSKEYTQDGDNNEEQCRWCALDGSIVKCTNCRNSFCESCIKRNLGDKILGDIQHEEEWKCFLCNPEPIQELQMNCVMVRSKLKEVPTKKQAESDGTSSDSPITTTAEITTTVEKPTKTSTLKLSEDVKCTACSSKIKLYCDIREHPALKVLICDGCYDFYESGAIKTDDDGVDEQCRWCAEGGNLLGCDACHNTFCKKCITRNFSKEAYKEIEKKDYWKCYVCVDEPLKELQENCKRIIESELTATEVTTPERRNSLDRKRKSDEKVSTKKTERKKSEKTPGRRQSIKESDERNSKIGEKTDSKRRSTKKVEDLNETNESPENLKCTACNHEINKPSSLNVRIHPALKVIVCKKCYEFYNSGAIKKDEDGVDEQCRWCAEGGNLLGCDTCNNTFCKKCIVRNFDKDTFKTIEKKKIWECFLCNDKPMKKLHQQCNAIQKELNIVEESHPESKDKKADDDVMVVDEDGDCEMEIEETNELNENNSDDVTCTACGDDIVKPNDTNVLIHPVLNVIVCKACHKLDENAAIEKDDDGKDNRCRWCAEGGSLLACDVCHNAFCEVCIERNLSEDILQEIKKIDKWECFVCNEEQIQTLQKKCKKIHDQFSTTKKTRKSVGEKEKKSVEKPKKNDKKAQKNEDMEIDEISDDGSDDEWQEEVKVKKDKVKETSCTACGKKIANPNSQNVCEHAALKVTVCKACHGFYKSGKITKDEDGIDEQCRWCAEGGNLLGCDACHNTFCKKCITRNFSKEKFKEIEKKDYWKCFVCDDKPLKALQKKCKDVLETVDKGDKNTRRKSRGKPKKRDDIDEDDIEDEPSIESDIEMEEVSEVLKNLMCTSCGRDILIPDAKNVLEHPELNVIVCKKCHNLYENAEIKQDDDGVDEQCRWCAGESGELIRCDSCHNTFCNRCIDRNFEKDYFKELERKKHWKCFVCDDEPLTELQKKCDAAQNELHPEESESRKANREKKNDKTLEKINHKVDDDSDSDVDEVKALLKDLVCTACGHEIEKPDANNVMVHPSLNAIICEDCWKHVTTIEDDSDDLCSWCKQQRQKCVECDDCDNSFCKLCIIRNFSKSEYREVLTKKKWKCYICKPRVLKMAEIREACEKLKKYLKLPDTVTNVDIKKQAFKKKQEEKKKQEDKRKQNQKNKVEASKMAAKKRQSKSARDEDGEQDDVQDSEDDANDTSKKIKCSTPKGPARCVVCNDNSTGAPYGVNSCDGCNRFFKKALKDGSKYKCKKSSKCVINKNTRDDCHYCRFKKCKKMGMSDQDDESDILNDTSVTSSKEVSSSILCVVCEDQATGFHYGVELCEACREFYRKSINKELKYQCQNSKKCVIKKSTRKDCHFCHLQKCRSKGLSKEDVNDIWDSVMCTSCGSNISEDNCREHPTLNVLICSKCLRFYKCQSYSQDSDGVDEQCQWCAHGGDLLGCDDCYKAFCKSCIKRNFGIHTIRSIENKKLWKCFICNPKPLKDIKSEYEIIEKKIENFSNNQHTRLKVPESIFVHPENVNSVLQKLKLTSKTFMVLLDKIEKDISGSGSQKNLQKQSLNLVKDGSTKILTTGIKLLLDSFSNILMASYSKSDKTKGVNELSDSRRSSIMSNETGRNTDDEVSSIQSRTEQQKKRKGKAVTPAQSKTKKTKSKKSAAHSDEESDDSEAESRQQNHKSFNNQTEVVFSDSDSYFDCDIDHVGKNMSKGADSSKKDDVWFNVVVSDAKSKKQGSQRKSLTKKGNQKKGSAKKNFQNADDNSDADEDLDENEAAKRFFMKQLSELENSDDDESEKKRSSRSENRKSKGLANKRKSASSKKKRESDDEPDAVKQTTRSKKRKLEDSDDDLPAVLPPRKSKNRKEDESGSEDSGDDYKPSSSVSVNIKKKRRSTRH